MISLNFVIQSVNSELSSIKPRHPSSSPVCPEARERNMLSAEMFPSNQKQIGRRPCDKILDNPHDDRRRMKDRACQACHKSNVFIPLAPLSVQMISSLLIPFSSMMFSVSGVSNRSVCRPPFSKEMLVPM